MKRVLAAIPLSALLLSCSNVQVNRVPVSASLEPAESPPTTVVRNVRIAVIRPDIVNDPERRVRLTNAFAESYPTLSHLVVAVPEALREVGFQVLLARSLEDAQAQKPEFILMLAEPAVTAAHPAEGSRVTLTGSSYDVRVRYQGALMSSSQAPLGVVVGYGQDTNRWLFMEPLFKQAMVGIAISAATFAASLLALSVIFYVGLVATLATGDGEPFGWCNPSGGAVYKYTPAPPFTSGKVAADGKQDLCTQAVNYGLSFAFVTAVSFMTGIAGSIGGTIGENIVDVVLAGMHMTTVDPSWRGMVKRAHDGAARDLAASVADRALHPYAGPPVVPPAPEPKPAVTPEAAPSTQPVPATPPAEPSAPSSAAPVSQ